MDTVDCYLGKGYEPKYAAYFAAGGRTIQKVSALSQKKLLLAFDNGEERILDLCEKIQPGTVFAFLADEENFQRVYLDEDRSVCWDIDPTVDSCVVWSNKVDICPDVCYVDSIPIEKT